MATTLRREGTLARTQCTTRNTHENSAGQQGGGGIEPDPSLTAVRAIFGRRHSSGSAVGRATISESPLR